jgi:arylsulfatase A-like enzyme
VSRGSISAFSSTLLALAACAETAPEENSRHRIDLLEELDLATISAPEWHADAFAANLLHEENFEEPLHPGWFSVRWERRQAEGGVPDERLSGARQTQDPKSQEAVLGIPPHTQGLALLLPSRPQHSLLVQASVRALLASEEHPGGLWVASLEQDPGKLKSGDLARPMAKGWVPGEEAIRESILDPSLGEQWQELEILLPPQSARRGIRILLQPGIAGVLLSHLRVARLTATEVALRGELQSLPRREFFRDRDRSADCLLLAADTELRWPVRIPQQSARFDADLALRNLGHPGEMQLELRFNQQPVAEILLTGEESQVSTGFRPWVTALETFAGQKGILSIRVRSGIGLLGLLANPRLLGRPAVTPGQPNLVLISLDTLRADHLGCYGDKGGLTPHLDTLAAAGTVFLNTLSTSSYTLPSHASLMSGQTPLVHGTLLQTHGLNPERSALLAVTLREQGYLTAAYTGGGFVSPEFGFRHGFDLFDVADPGGIRQLFQPTAPSPEESLAPTLQWLERHHDQPFFLFVHTYLVHNYTPHPRYRPEGIVDDSKQLMQLFSRAKHKQDAEAVVPLRRLYEATLRQADREIVQSLDQKLQQLGVRERTLFVVVSDHGEGFLEHEQFAHGESLWGELLRVPWILSGPGVEKGLQVEAMVSLSDVAPTLLTLMQLPREPSMTGRDVLSAPPRDLEEILVWREVNSDEGWDALLSDPWKLLRRRATSEQPEQYLLFRMDEDPLDHQDLSAARPQQADTLQARLQHRLQELEQQLLRQDRATSSMDAALQEQLRALGYVDGD